jgi:Ca2+/Na+ antiporter
VTLDVLGMFIIMDNGNNNEDFRAREIRLRAVNRDEVLVMHRYRLARLAIIYILVLFIVIRVWMLVVATKDVSIISAAAAITFILLLVWLRYHRLRIAREIEQRDRNNEFFAIVVNNQIEIMNERRRLLAQLHRQHGGGVGMSDADIALLPVTKYDPEDHTGRDIESASSTSSGESLIAQRDGHTGQHGSDNPSCSVCLCDYVLGDQLITLPCHHFYHQECITEWLKLRNVCPMCKLVINSPRGGDGDVETGNAREGAPAVETAENIARTDLI